MTAIIGSGGKTSLMMRLAEELAERGRVIVCTSTHIMRPEGIPTAATEEELVAELELQDECGKNVPICIGTPAENGKLTAPKESFEELTGFADYVLVEADGAKRLPLKCHAPHEPVIPENADKVILVIGLSGIGKKAGEAVHRPELFEQLTGLGPEDTVTTDAVAKAVAAEAGRFVNRAGAGNDRCDLAFTVFINQADTDEAFAQACEAAQELKRTFSAEAGSANVRIFAGSVRNGYIRAAE